MKKIISYLLVGIFTAISSNSVAMIVADDNANRITTQQHQQKQQLSGPAYLQSRLDNLDEEDRLEKEKKVRAKIKAKLEVFLLNAPSYKEIDLSMRINFECADKILKEIKVNKAFYEPNLKHLNKVAKKQQMNSIKITKLFFS